jgi:hypothetical protein
MWPLDKSVSQCPSIISYTQKDGPPLWGFEVKPGMQAYAWTKLLLDRDLENGDFNDEVLEKVTGLGILRLPDGKEAIDTVTDFLSLIYAHICAYIPENVKPRDGYLVDLNGVPIDFWFTFLASWSEEKQCLIREAIQKAGFGSTPLHRIWTTTEPEAAALAIFNSRKFNFEVSRNTSNSDSSTKHFIH